MGIYERAIVKTLCYASVFEFPLTKAELWRYLIWETKKKPLFFSFLKAINTLRGDKKIYVIKGSYLLKRNWSWVKIRQNQSKIAKKKYLLAKKATRFLSLIPTVLYICLTGRLALSVARREDDIDLLIISRSKTLWLTRLIALVLLSLLGLKRKPEDKNYANKICLNMLMDKDHLYLSKKEQDIYSAHEVSQMRTLFDRGDCYNDFIAKNKWVKRYLVNATGDIKITRGDNPKRSKRLIYLLSLFEKPAESLQIWYMRKRRTSEVINKGYLRFHPKDAREWVLPRYNEIVKKHVARNI